jgi:hypothetical protein
MKTTKHFLLAAVFALVSALGAGVTAQGQMNSAFPLPPEPIDPVTQVTAVEVSDGTLGYHSETKQKTAFGYSFLGQTTGAFPGSFTISMDCAPPPSVLEADETGVIGIIPIKPPNSELTGGSWTLPVYFTSERLGVNYAGSLYGTVSKGTMTWDTTGTNATIYIVLNVEGGTQAWEAVGGFATFTGKLYVDEKTQKTTISGSLVFNIISAKVE